MALSPCSTVTDLHQRELVEHGSISFPLACYHDDLPLETVPWHWHEEWEFAVVTEGILEFCLPNTRIRLNTGEGIFINSGALHAVEPVENSRGRLHSAVFHPRLVGGSADSFFYQTLVQPLLRDSSLQYVVLRPSVSWQQEMMAAFQMAWQAVVEETEDYENTARYLLSKVMGILHRSGAVAMQVRSVQEQTDAVRIRAMLEYIEDHYGEDLTLEEIAGSVTVSESVCLRCFNRMLGTTPVQYLKQLRLGKAAEQLLSTEKTAREIALDCGFNDVSYFTKAFREKTGLTPGAYRRERR